jgi:hypothetical protein
MTINNLADDQNVVITITGVTDDVGNLIAGAVPDTGSLTATVSDGVEATATVDPSGTFVTVTALGPIDPNAEVVTLSATYQGSPITATVSFNITTGTPSALGVSVGTPQHN